MKIVVTGATGFIGRFCLPLLVEKGFEVHGITSKRPVDMPGIKMHSLNLLESLGLDDFLQKLRPTHLLHLAWITEPAVFWNSPDNHRWVEASLCLLQKFKDCGGIRAVVAGTCADQNPTTLYGISKKTVFNLLQRIDLSSAWGRIFHLYGPYENSRRFVPSVILSLLKGKETLCTHGNQIRDFSFVGDVAKVLVDLVMNSVQGPIDIGSAAPTSIKNLCLKIGEKIGNPEKIVFGAIPTSPDEPAILVPDVKPVYNFKTLNEGLEETIQWWKLQQSSQPIEGLKS